MATTSAPSNINGASRSDAISIPDETTKRAVTTTPTNEINRIKTTFGIPFLSGGDAILVESTVGSQFFAMKYVFIT